MSHNHRLFLSISLLVAGFAAFALGGYPLAAKAEAKSDSARHSHSRAAKPPSPDSQIVTKAYGVWALRCRKANGKKGEAAKAPQDRACEISETLEAQDHSGPIAKLSVGRPGSKGALHAVVILPNNISFPSSVHIRSDDKDIWGVNLDWVRCIPGGCFAETILSDATVKHWHDSKSKGQIVFKDASGDDVSLPMSFVGFGEALDALEKEP
jgi:invasion protein IalB